jgi:NAD+ synthase (glutamine-hydrolysing)
MRLALAQMNPTTGDIKGNTEKIIGQIREAEKGLADLIIFPEMAVTGYCLSDQIEDPYFLRENLSALDRIAEHTYGVTAVVGYVDAKFNGRRIERYNAAAVLQNGAHLGTAQKTNLPNYRYFDDKRYFLPGEKRQPITAHIAGRDVRLGVSVCEDMWDEDYSTKPVKELAEQGAEIIININASPFYAGKFKDRDKVIRRHVKGTGLPFVYVNTVGAGDIGKNIIPFEGQSLAYNSDSDLVAVGKQFKEEILFVDLDHAKKIPLPQIDFRKETFDALVMALRDYGKKNGFRTALQSVSGGIDSALGLAITVEAFGPENVVAYNLPSRYNTKTTRNIAEELANNFKVDYRILPIEDIDSSIRTTEKLSPFSPTKIGSENIHARIRGLLMMREANNSGSLLVSNGNKTEIALGYATLYGDMCGGVSVIGDLSKTDVYRIAQYVNEKYGRDMIPGEAFTIKPSAELSEGQFDPFDYPVVSPLVDEFAVNRKSPREVVDLFKGRALDPGLFDPSIYSKYDEKSFTDLVFDTHRKLRKSVYKRLQGPPIISVTKRAFGFDLREPLINGWDGGEGV